MHRRLVALALAGILVGAGPAAMPGAGAAQPAAGPAAVARPPGPNPYLSYLADPGAVDHAAWRSWLEQQAAATAGRPVPSGAPVPLDVDEVEPPGTSGRNDTRATAERVAGFGTAAGANPRAHIAGSLVGASVPHVAIAPNQEDDGSIPRARNTNIGVAPGRHGVSTTGTVGDGPHGSGGSGRGDFDHFRLRASAGQTITVDTDTPSGVLDTTVTVYDADGVELGFNDDSDGFDSHLEVKVPETGTYDVSVGAFATLQEDPFDSGSGIGAASEGPYAVTIDAFAHDADTFAVNVRVGDVIGVGLAGSAEQIAILGPGGRELMGSQFNVDFIRPSVSPLPDEGRATAEHVAALAGTYFVSVDKGVGSYEATVEVYRPPLEAEARAQTIFLDFNGTTVDAGIWGGEGVRTLSPLRSFLDEWNLDPDQRHELIGRIINTTRESLEADLAARGLNDDFRIRIRNSRDHADPFGQPNVSRVIVGGTIGELGIDTIGVAESIDPGNFDQEESAVVLLDVLSADPGPRASLNTYLGPGSARVAFIARGVANIVAHEAGHFFGDWHVDQFNAAANLMDQGGNPALMFGVGPDGRGGTADDVDVDFGLDVFNPNEGLTGLEHTLTRVSQALR